ncbi:hypothetical protein BDA96_01G338700 [Sorghum bicolor]|uniref:Uncharacterized protein n=2 Tax=Sorghum bicolor TaxID=4558 RepID=A0A921S1U5_SORBI|nr:hypothetical protein BDA96_01G338700 [Sorghum bicolor]OQU92248.1 hypothetical protein SORBI_3001G315901 [Sorghum bicolor]
MEAALRIYLGPSKHIIYQVHDHSMHAKKTQNTPISISRLASVRKRSKGIHNHICYCKLSIA